jgi:hypothetical protein
MSSPAIVPARNGAPTLKWGEDYLEDAADPAHGATFLVPKDKLDGTALVVLFGAGLGHRARYLTSIGARVVVFEPSPEIAALAREHAPDVFPSVPLFTDRTPLLAHLVEATMSGQSTKLLRPPAYERVFPAAVATVVSVLAEVEKLKKIRLNTIRGRYNHAVESALGNLHMLAEIPLYTALGRPLEGCPAFIVSAGPSLDRNGALLARAQQKGVIFTVNTASPAVLAHGASIDVLACIEALDVTKSLERSAPHARLVALDVSANAANYGVAARARTMFMSASEPYLELAPSLGSRVLPYGASVATAAFALAYALGADPIVLVGQDLSYTGGRLYAKHTGREGMTARRDGGRVHFAYDESFLAGFRDKGITTPPASQPAIDVPAWGGGTTFTTFDMLLFLRWFESQAHAIGSSRRLINATEGGVSLAGFAEERLEDVLASLPPRREALDEAIAAAQPLSRARVDRLCTEVARSARDVIKALRRCREASPKKAERAARDLRDSIQHARFVDVHATPALLALKDETLQPDVRRDRTFGAIEASAALVARLVRAA